MRPRSPRSDAPARRPAIAVLVGALLVGLPAAGRPADPAAGVAQPRLELEVPLASVERPGAASFLMRESGRAGQDLEAGVGLFGGAAAFVRMASRHRALDTVSGRLQVVVYSTAPLPPNTDPTTLALEEKESRGWTVALGIVDVTGEQHPIAPVEDAELGHPENNAPYAVAERGWGQAVVTLGLGSGRYTRGTFGAFGGLEYQLKGTPLSAKGEYDGRHVNAAVGYVVETLTMGPVSPRLALMLGGRGLEASGQGFFVARVTLPPRRRIVVAAQPSAN